MGIQDYYHSTWYNIHYRCNQPTHPRYGDYGGRGITLYWEDREAFKQYILTTLGERPSALHSLDRKNNNKGYEPGNLRWATKKQQSDNRREFRSDRKWKWVHSHHCGGFQGKLFHKGKQYVTEKGENPADVYLKVLSLRSLLRG